MNIRSRPQINNQQSEINNSPMTVDSIRRFCLSFPQAKENLQWGDDLCFKVGGKIFAVLALGLVPQGISLKCAPERFAELVEQEGIVPAPYVGGYKWVLLERLDALREVELEDLIRQSYEMVSAKLRKAKRGKRNSLKRTRSAI
ncbi:MAG: MmcQ/YjbR family DNA-binding protein [bacterium]